ncbi:MAG: hypothetical protein IJ455_06835 [Agathobacter sp.]|nr:hypothetical protein [Agathobacter sp.]
MDNILKDNPLLNGMDPEKLQFIMNFAQKDKPTNMKDAMPFLLANMNIAKKQNINFTHPEIQLIAEILSKDLSPSEKAKVNKIMSMMLK